MPKGHDVGTMNLCKGELDEMTGNPVFTSERNVFLKAASGEDTESTLKENNWSYVKYNDEFYILGEDAIKLKNLLTIKTDESTRNIVSTKVGDLRRPMKDGLINTGEEKLAIAIIQKLISNLLGPPAYPGEHLVFCVPADPVNQNASVVFHKSILTGFLKSLGYTVESISEALAIIFSERPTAEDPSEPNGESAFTGIGISLGSGMANIVFALKKMPLINFSVSHCGDWIDQEASKVAGIDQSVMTKFKEKNLNLNKIDHSDIRQVALDIFYQSMIENVLNHLSEKFNKLDTTIEFPVEIVVAGGTASVPGFIDKFESVLDGLALPFKVKNVRLADNPLFTVTNGCLLKAMSNEKKSKPEIKKKGKD